MEETLGRQFRFTRLGARIHWSSKRVSLGEEPEVILKSFSENHRRSVKKAVTQGIEFRRIGPGEVGAFADGYVRMYRHRQLNVDPEQTLRSFEQLHRFLGETGKGFFMGAFREGMLLGGLIVIYQGETAFYYKGYIDHEQRQSPINHAAFYQAMLQARSDGLRWFDLGGYAVDTTDEQLININKFKDGFKGVLVSFPPTKMIGLRKLTGTLERLLKIAGR
jgi:lipid II:glycine glycyltransferase (peptidoglycan interpeptide bridge formation enzyme)